MSKIDKKTIVNDLHQAVLISIFAIGYSVLGKNIVKMTPPSIQKFDLYDTGKLVNIVTASEMMKEYLIKQKILWEHLNIWGSPKMASIAMLIGGALVSVLAFISSSYMFSMLSKDSIHAKRKRHDLAIKQLQKAQVEWA